MGEEDYSYLSNVSNDVEPGHYSKLYRRLTAAGLNLVECRDVLRAPTPGSPHTEHFQRN